MKRALVLFLFMFGGCSTGPAGPQGPMGAMGDPGATGPTGATGDPGATGAMGTAGSTGAMGTPGDSVVTTTLASGDANCPNGGASFTVGSTTTYACNGATGTIDPSTVIANGTAAQTANFHITGSGIVDGNVGVGTTAPSTGLMVIKGNAATLTKGTGMLQVGDDVTGGNINLAMDWQSIQVRTAAGLASSLALQPGGGNVGIGTSSPTSALEVAKGGEIRVRDATGNRYGRLIHGDQGNFFLDSVGGGAIFLNWNGGTDGVYVGNGNINFGHIYAAVFSAQSDARLKMHVRTIEHALDDVSRLRGVRFDWKRDGKPSVGVIAQDVEQVYPELVSTTTDGMKTVDYDKLVGVLIEATKELRRKNDELRRANAVLDERLSRIEARLTAKN